MILTCTDKWTKPPRNNCAWPLTRFKCYDFTFGTPIFKPPSSTRSRAWVGSWRWANPGGETNVRKWRGRSSRRKSRLVRKWRGRGSERESRLVWKWRGRGSERESGLIGWWRLEWGPEVVPVSWARLSGNRRLASYEPSQIQLGPPWIAHAQQTVYRLRSKDNVSLEKLQALQVKRSLGKKTAERTYLVCLYMYMQLFCLSMDSKCHWEGVYILESCASNVNRASTLSTYLPLFGHETVGRPEDWLSL